MKKDKDLPLDSIFSSFPGYISLIDTDFNLLLMHDDIGLFTNREIWIGDRCYATLRGRVSVCPNCSVKRVFDTGRRIRRLSPEEEQKSLGKVLDVIAEPLRDSQGKIWAAMEIAVDVSSLKKSERKYQTLFHSLSDIALLTDGTTGEIVEANSSAQEKLGYTKKEILGLRASDFAPPGKEKEYTERFAERAKKRHDSGDRSYLKTKNGFLIPVSVRTSRLMLEGRSYLYGIFRDLCREDELKKALEISEENLKQIMEHLPQVMWLSEDKKLVYINPAYEYVYKQSREKNYRRLFSFADAIHPEDRERVIESYNRAIKGEETCDEEYRLIWPDGEVRWIRARNYPFRVSKDGKIRIVGIAEDITEQKRLEADLQRESEINRILSEISTHIISPDFSCKEIIHEIGKAALRLTGSELVYVGKLEGEEGDANIPTFSNMGEGHYSNNSPDGSLRWYFGEGETYVHNLMVVPARYQGTHFGLISVANAEEGYKARDLEVLKRLAAVFGVVLFRNSTEEELKWRVTKQTAKLQKIDASLSKEILHRDKLEQELLLKEHAIDTSLTGFALTDGNGTICYVNRAMADMWGYVSPSEMLGTKAIYFWEDREQAVEVQQEVMDIGSWKGKLIAKRADGSLFPVFGSITVFDKHEEGEFSMVGTFLDISDLDHTRNKLQQTETFYRHLVENIHDLIVVLKENDGIEYTGPSIRSVLGYERLDVLGRECSEYIHEEDISLYRETMSLLWSRTKVRMKTELRMKHIDGTWLYFACTFKHVILGKDFPVIVLNCRNITQEKKEEHVAKERQIQLIRADKLASLGVMSAGIAHEINNPNQVIMSNGELLAEMWEDITPILEEHFERKGDFLAGGRAYSRIRGGSRSFFKSITHNAHRIDKIVNELKTFSRNEDSVHFSLVDVNELVQGASSLLSPLIRKSTDCFSIELDRTLPQIYGNRQQLEQVILNLIQNSCQALEDRKQKVEVRTSIAESENNIVVSIRDEGAGISPENLKKIRDPFFTTKGTKGGTGLGLSVASSIIKEHGGRMEFSSTLHVGTRADVYLPRYN